MKGRLYHRILAVALTVAMTIMSLPAAAVAEMADDVSTSMSSSQMSDAPSEANSSSEASNASENADASSQQSEVSEEVQRESSAESVSTKQTQPEVTATEGIAISSAQDLQDINNNLSGSYYLANDIDLTGVSFTPIGNKKAPFTGTFDGNGHKLTNLSINNGGRFSVGLFGYVKDGTVKNLGLTGHMVGSNNVGGIAGYVADGGTIENCYSEGKVSGDDYTGGIVGYVFKGSVNNCYSTSVVYGSSYVGGVAGYVETGTVSNCYNTGDVSSKKTNIGGVVGIVTAEGIIENCYNTGEVSVFGTKVGGVAGYVENHARVSNCYYNTDTIGLAKRAVGSGEVGENVSGLTLEQMTGTDALNQMQFTDPTAWVTLANEQDSNGTFSTYYYPQLTVFVADPHLPKPEEMVSTRGVDPTTYRWVSTADELQAINDNLKGNYVLAKDIDLAGVSFTPIGSSSTPFTGTLCGHDHTVKNLTLQNSKSDYQGLFGYVGDDGELIDVTVTGSSVRGEDYVGGVAGYVAVGGSVERSECTETTVTGNDYVGGVVGYMQGSMDDCYNGGEVFGCSDVGGLAGYMEGSLDDCYNTGVITGGDCVGGVVGYMQNNAGLENCYNTGEVSSSSDSVGGVVGYMLGIINECHNIGVVTGDDCAGGVAGYLEGGMHNSYNTGEVSGSSDVGGAVGYMEGTMTNCYNRGVVSSPSDSVGGVAGYFEGTMVNCSNIGEISGSSNVGGVAGYLAGSMEDSYNIGKLSGCSNVGGVAGYMHNIASMKNCYNTGQVTASDCRVGGVAGYVAGSIEDSHNTGEISGSSYVGGVAGYLAGSIENSYNTGKVSGSSDVGGVAGYLAASIENCYNNGGIFGCSNVGGVAGWMADQADINNSYNTGAVSSSSDQYSYAGGVVGFMCGTVENCHNTGAVFAAGCCAGGVTGNMSGTLRNCYNTGKATGAYNVGGIAGYVSNGSVENCYNVGVVSASDFFYSSVGGVAGTLDSSGFVSNCYNTAAVFSSSNSPNLSIGSVAGATYHKHVSNCYYEEDNTGNATKAIGTGTAGENVSGLALQQMIGSDALENMVFTSEAGTWVTLKTPTPTELDENGLYCAYIPQLSTLVADSANPKPEEMVSISLTAMVDLANGSVTLSSHDGNLQITQGDETYCTVKHSVRINNEDVSSNTVTIDSSFQNTVPVILKDVNINTSESGIKVSEGADVEFVLKGNNNVVSSVGMEKVDYAAIEVPGGATATFSGDGTLNATARGYGAAIGTKGYYRDGKNHSNNSKSSGVVNIKGSVHIVATSGHGAGIGGGAISGSTCVQKAFDNGEVYISEDAIVEATCTDGYSAGIGGGGCYTSTCEGTGGDGGIVEVSGNAEVTAKCTGSLGAGIGGGGAHTKTCNAYAGDGERFVSKDNAVIHAYGGLCAPGIGGGGAEHECFFGTYCGDGGDVILQGNTVVSAHSAGVASGIDSGKHSGGYFNFAGKAPTIQKEDSVVLYDD